MRPVQARNPLLQEYLALPWVPKLEALQDGTCRLTVPPLRDLELFGARAELLAEWRNALTSHLEAYLTAGKVIPTPRLWGEPSSSRPGVSQASGALDWRPQLV